MWGKKEFKMEIAKYIMYRNYIFCICSSGFSPNHVSKWNY